jgi:transcriptional regulator with XRE-family HTH domain
MAIDRQHVAKIIDQVFAGQDMRDACQRRDVGAIIRILGKYGVTQGQIASLTGIAQGRLSEYKTGKRLPSATSTFEAFADGLGLPAHARRALGLAPHTTTDSTETGEGFGVPADTFDLQVLAEAVGKRSDAVNRREMLAMAAKIGATTALAQSEAWERVAYALGKPSALDESVIREMEARSAGFHRLEEIIPAPALFKGLAAHLREVGTLLNGIPADASDKLRARLIVVAGESSVLAGWAASDMGHIAVARNYYETAERAAKEADDPAILACSLAYRSYIPSTKGAHGRSRALLKTALEALSGYSASPGTLSWIAARHAEESAALGDRSQALTSWARADEAYSIADPDDDRVWTKFLDQQRFDSYHITTYANIGKLEEAQNLATQVLSRLGSPDRKKAVIILEGIAAAHIAQGSINEGATLAKKGLAITRETEFAMWLPKFDTIGQSISRWRSQAPVRAFLEDLAMTKRHFASSLR